MIDRENDLRWMRAALSLGKRGLGRAWPNPAVGCVIVDPATNTPVGRGWTQPGGRPHAERIALKQAGERARGAVAYVTLEPCAHHGVTSPCSEALIEAGVARVVSALEDPEPRVAGRGAQMLRNAGVEVVSGVCEDEAREDHIGHLTRVHHSRPATVLKLASTLDGKIATQTGESQWISCPCAREYAHLLRARNDAILVGAGTARMDDPSLDVRLPGLEAHSPVRVVADGGLSTPMDSNLAKRTPQSPLWMLHRADAPSDRKERWRDIGATLIEVPADAEGRLDLSAALGALSEGGITRLMCEGGGRMAAALMKADLVDRLSWVSAGAVIGAEGPGAIAQLGVTHLAEAPRFKRVSTRALGADVLMEWRRLRDQ